MPVRKEWVVDEKGYHAKSVWESSQSSTAPVSDDDSDGSKASPKKSCSPYAKVTLEDPELIPGPDGFAFNKQFKVKANVKIHDDSIKKRVTFRLLCKYDKKEYEIKPPVEGAVHNNTAEVDMTLYYGESQEGCTYYEDSLKDPSVTCEYIVRVSHPATSTVKKSKPLEMPQKDSEEKLYGGFELQKGDSDSEKKWGGKQQEKEGDKNKYLKELQEDLVKLGYWVSNGKGTNGMKCSGIFDKYTAGAVITFQREHKLSEDGIIRKDTGNKIKECCKKANYQRPSHKAGGYGKFVQLKPSENYIRYFASYDNSNILKDVWGTQDTVKLVEDVAKEWKSKGCGVFMVGDISLYNGGKFTGHETHRDGTGVDIDHSVCSIDKSGFNRNNSLILAELFKKYGAKRILFNCKYVTDNCTIAYPCKLHHNHFHVDTKESEPPKANQDGWLCKDCISSNSSDCPHKVKEETKDDKKKENTNDVKKS